MLKITQKQPTHFKRANPKLQNKGTQPPPQTNPQQDPDEPETATTTQPCTRDQTMYGQKRRNLTRRSPPTSEKTTNQKTTRST